MSDAPKEVEMAGVGSESKPSVSVPPDGMIEAVKPASTNLDEELGLDFNFEVVGRVRPVRMAWEGVGLTVNNKAAVASALPCKRPDPSIPKRVTILKNASGRVYPGELLAVMGASGAGKTTLLNVVSRRNQSNEGVVTVNGQAVDEPVFKQLSAYVQQEDLFLGSLTVREHLMYQARLRMPEEVKEEDRVKRVDALITALRLTKCQGNVIGAISRGESRGISGGERKRLSFASEILTDPSILFADEPTSGLDSHMAMNVVRMMKELAVESRTVVATIHQPSSEVYSMFDCLLLMHDGRCVYHGYREDAVEYFAAFGDDFRCPTYTNPADFFIRMLAVSNSADRRYSTVISMADAWEASDYKARFDARSAPPEGMTVTTLFPEGQDGEGAAAQEPATEGAGEDGVSRSSTPKSATQVVPLAVQGSDVGTKTNPLDDDGADTALAIKPRQQLGWWRQFQILSSRAVTATSRDPILTYARLGQSIVLGLIVGLIYFRIDDDQDSIQNKNGAAFFILINQSFSAIFGVVQTFPLERPIFQREHEAGHYKVLPYFLAKQISDIPFQIFFPILFCCIAYWMIGLRDDFMSFISFTGVILLASNTAISLGYFISTAAPTVEIALAIAPVVILPFLLFGGLFVNVSTIPDALVWLESVSWFKYAYQVIGTIVWGDGVTIGGCDPLTAGPDEVCITSGEQVLSQYFPERNTAVDVWVLVAMVIGYRVLSFLALYRRAKNRQNE